MRNICFVISIVLILSCNKKRTIDYQIAEFEKVLGMIQTKAFDLLVADFEKNLVKIYPKLSIEEGYLQYLIDIKSDTITDWNKFEFKSLNAEKEYYASGLRNEIYESNSVSLKANNLGKYMRALYQLRNSDSLVKEYWDKREAAGIMPNSVVVDGILSLNPDFTNYFHKRIVIAEFSY